MMGRGRVGADSNNSTLNRVLYNFFFFLGQVHPVHGKAASKCRRLTTSSFTWRTGGAMAGRRREDRSPCACTPPCAPRIGCSWAGRTLRALKTPRAHWCADLTLWGFPILVLLFVFCLWRTPKSAKRYGHFYTLLVLSLWIVFNFLIKVLQY